MDCAFFAIAFNIKKLSSKIAKQTNNGEIHPFLPVFAYIADFTARESNILGKTSEIGRLKNIQTSVAEK